MPELVTIVDYGIGNIFSVERAFQKFGAKTLLTDRPADIANATRLVLPGVGAFPNGMAGLRERGLIEPLQAYAKSGRPMLGICLGMQMLFTESSEFGEHRGLDIVGGRIVPIQPKGEDGVSLKVPHIGWNNLVHPKNGATWETSLLKYVKENEQCYFVHSFTAEYDDDADRLADAYYGSARIAAAVAKGKVFGCQFHPEKSGTIGLKMIQRFLEI